MLLAVEMEGTTMIWGAVGLVLLVLATLIAERLWWRPRRLERALRAQGLNGTRYRFLYGDLKEFAQLYSKAKSKPMPLSHDILPRVMAFYHRCTKQYGKICFTWFGPTSRVIISDPEMIKEVLSTKITHFGKSSTPIFRQFVKGMLDYDGEKWTKHRRILNPAFHVEKLKGMLPAFSTCCSELINKWECMVSPRGSCEIDVWPELQKFIGDVISQAAFSSSYEEGSRLFQLQTEQAQLVLRGLQTSSIPGYRFVLS